MGGHVRNWPEPSRSNWAAVNALVNNAGLAQVLAFAMIEEADWDLMMDVNVKGMFLRPRRSLEA